MKLARSTYYYRSRRAAAEKIKLRDRIDTLCAKSFRATATGGSRPNCGPKER